MFNVLQPDWIAKANCKTISKHYFFPTNGPESAEFRKLLKPICDACEVFDDCFRYAMSFSEKQLQGIWANTTENDRRRMRYSDTPIRYVQRTRRKEPDQ